VRHTDLNLPSRLVESSLKHLCSPTSKQNLVRRSDLSSVSESARTGCLAIQSVYGLDESSVTNYLCTFDGQEAYPVVDDIPFLVSSSMALREVETRGLREEIEVYDAIVREQLSVEDAPIISDNLVPDHPVTIQERNWFPLPIERWLDAPYDSPAQYRAYEYLQPLSDNRVLQLGGQGDHAVKLIFAGAHQTILVTPVYAEALYAQELARNYGVMDKTQFIVGTAEDLPLEESSVDRVYAGGTLHHTLVDVAVGEILRVLVPGGKFAAVEPWRTPFYRIGTALFGKRERDVLCRPIEKSRLPELSPNVSDFSVVQFGTFTRHPLLALSKIGFQPRLKTIWKILRADDFVASKIPFMRRFGSSVCVTFSKTQQGE